MNKKTLTIIQAILAIIFIFSSMKIYQYNQNLKQSDDIEINSRELLNNLDRPKLLTKEEEAVEELLKQQVQISKDLIAKLTEDYPDIIGHIDIEDTTISYPIVQAEDNKFYLSHAPTKDKNANGSIFLNYLNKSDFSDDNTIIYGHNVKSGKLFQNLHKFKEQHFYDKINIINVHTNEGPKTYKIFSVYVTDPEYQYKHANFNNAYDKVTFFDEIKEKSIIKNEEVLLNENSKIITLSTCEPNGAKRLVVHGIEILD